MKISTVSSSNFYQTYNTISSFALDKDEQEQEEFASTEASVASRTRRFCFRNPRSRLQEIVMRHTAGLRRPRPFNFVRAGGRHRQTV